VNSEVETGEIGEGLMDAIACFQVAPDNLDVVQERIWSAVK